MLLKTVFCFKITRSNSAANHGALRARGGGGGETPI